MRRRELHEAGRTRGFRRQFRPDVRVVPEIGVQMLATHRWTRRRRVVPEVDETLQLVHRVWPVVVALLLPVAKESRMECE